MVIISIRKAQKTIVGFTTIIHTAVHKSVEEVARRTNISLPRESTVLKIQNEDGAAETKYG